MEISLYGMNIFRDAIVLEDGVTLTDNEIDAIKQQRFDNWIAFITTIPENTDNIEISELAPSSAET